ncbi:MAG: hypothetical protein NWE83_02405 [Candidatus Bathyarchaeota archaeon]|nr:hypothetical protein [Candidatus Bathyarchaeota archaeon]
MSSQWLQERIDLIRASYKRLLKYSLPLISVYIFVNVGVVFGWLNSSTLIPAMGVTWIATIGLYVIDYADPPLRRNVPLIAILVFASMIAAYTVITQWDDIMWEATMRFQYTLHDAKGDVVPNMILEANDVNYTKIYYLSNTASIPFRLVDLDGQLVGVQQHWSKSRVQPNDTITISFWVREPLPQNEIIEARLVPLTS